ncbi:nucleoside-diphosphate sugar epimerase/dehydratase [Cyanobium sp. NIES-981]|uniref:polysaccharide biosynthesis protein n=1 Tax=Cyanobium sp. NIES-981 TaxID=1851505 RepID=UPI0007DDC760|nr:nucleoside-diphosphate sugar epimerase/dehydratase [Cyanobium sp. NIES-981]SBO44016.1 Polysaccharide biosynthesis protein CapD [Cyanobium sp. NIES-981]
MALRIRWPRLGRIPLLLRRLPLLAADVVLLPLAVWVSFLLRLGDPWPPELQQSLWLLPTVLVIGLPLYSLSGQYRGLARYVGSAALYQLAVRNALLVLLVAFAGLQLQQPAPPRSSWLLLWILLTVFTGGLRFALRDLLLGRAPSGPRPRRQRVVIMGAGAAAAQLAAALRLGHDTRIAAFLDDDPGLWHRTLYGVPVLPPGHLPRLLRSGRVDQLILSTPSLPQAERRRLLARLQGYGVPVLQVPSVEEIASGRARIDTLRPVPIEDLLGRESVPPDPALLAEAISGRSVLVSGAGGSIGAELCHQILRLRPARLVLLERSELALYAIGQELASSVTDVPVIEVLGDVAEQALVERLLRSHAVQVLFHAAAYKHVPLVEANICAGLANNIFGTRSALLASLACGLERFTLISTDKAVRPTNAMGASKRVCELLVQNAAAAQRAHPGGTICSMVRFGNVLGSSGSVVPLFRRQIAAGGPLTVTHPEITRFFMTIPEAVQLVLQASAMASGGEVFLLDMGEPVRIADLARQMIQLSGASVRDADHPDGEIEIHYTGLRPGEKLHEELLLAAASDPTAHPLIRRAREASLSPPQLTVLLAAMEAALRRWDEPGALAVLRRLVPDYRPPAPGSATGVAGQPR